LGASAEQPNPSDVYLRVSPSSWDSKKNRPEPAAFKLRTGQTKLSVYCVDMQTARGVLQLCIDDQKRRLASPDPESRDKAGRFLDANGTTVEEFIANDWHVVRLPAVAFTDRGFSIEAPDPDGHQNVIGDSNEFKRWARELIGCSTALTAEECLG
jgi:hypothetical protein